MDRQTDTKSDNVFSPPPPITLGYDVMTVVKCHILYWCILFGFFSFEAVDPGFQQMGLAPKKV